MAAIKSNLTSNETQFKFGIDSDGNYGYYKAGADIVTPFKTGETIYGSSSVTEVILAINGYQFQSFTIDVTNINGLLYLLSTTNQTSSINKYEGMYGYSDWDTAVSDKYAAIHGNKLLDINNISYTKQKWSYIDLTNVFYLKIIMPYDGGYGYFALPYSEKDKVIKRIQSYAGTYNEIIYKYPSLHANCLRYTRKDSDQKTSIIIDPDRIFPTIGLGYGTTVSGSTSKSLLGEGSSVLVPDVGRDESDYSTMGCYCHCGGQQYQNSFEVLLEVVE